MMAGFVKVRTSVVVFCIGVTLGCSPAAPPPPAAEPLPTPAPIDAGAAPTASAPPPPAKPPPPAIEISEACVPAEARARASQCVASSPPTRADVYNAMSDANNKETVPDPNGRAKDRKVVLARKTAPPLHARELATLGAYVCANPTDYEMMSDYARAHFELNDWEAASFLYARVTNGPPETEVGIFAAQLMLEALNILASTFDRTACWGDMERAVPLIRAKLCTPAALAKSHNDEACNTLAEIQGDLDKRKQAPRKK